MTDDIRPEETFGESVDEADAPQLGVDDADPGVTSVIESLRDEFGVSDTADIVVERPEPAAEEEVDPWATDEASEEELAGQAPSTEGEAPSAPWVPGTFAELLDPPLDAYLPVAPSILDQAAPREMDLGPEKRVRWWPWALAGFGVVLLLGAVGYGWWWVTARPIVAPDVIGKRPAEATQTLNDLDLRLGAVSEIPTDTAPVGTIIGQKPSAGTELKPDEKIDLVLAFLSELFQ